MVLREVFCGLALAATLALSACSGGGSTSGSLPLAPSGSARHVRDVVGGSAGFTASATPMTTGTVVGRVIDAASVPVTEATVDLLAADGTRVVETTSGRSGRFRLQAITPGTYRLATAGSTTPLVVKAGEITDLGDVSD